MRTFLPLLALALGPAVGGQAGLPAPDVGRDWVPLSEWAGQNDFKPAWLKEKTTFALAGGSGTLSLKMDSLLAQINGVTVWLSEPAVVRNGEACLSRLDLQTAINPILLPHARTVAPGLPIICLDPGHGGHDTGGLAGPDEEKSYTMPLAEELAGQLRVAGFKVILTRTNDSFVALEDRPALANRAGAGLFISLHFNIVVPGQAHGVEVYCLTPARAWSTNAGGRGLDTEPWPGNRFDDENELFAYQLQKSLVQNLPVEDRRSRRARFAVLCTAEMPAVLIEGGFLSDTIELRQIADPKYRSRLARAIVMGVLAYQHQIKS